MRLDGKDHQAKAHRHRQEDANERAEHPSREVGTGDLHDRRAARNGDNGEGEG